MGPQGCNGEMVAAGARRRNDGSKSRRDGKGRKEVEGISGTIEVGRRYGLV